MIQTVQLISLLLTLLVVIFWLWMLSEMMKNDSLPGNSSPLLTWPPSSKYSWLLLFIFLNAFGAALYYVFEYRKRP
jgi:hypothetical protein